jgi:hypothetical protein
MRVWSARIPLIVAGLHAVIALLILLDGWRRSDGLFPFAMLMLLDWPISVPLYLLIGWIFPPDVSTHASTATSNIALGTLLVVVGSAWYYFLTAVAVRILRRGGFNI